MLQLPPVNPPGEAPAVASALVALAQSNVAVLGVHCRGSDQYGSALARAAGAAGVAHTISLPATPAAALAAAGVALCTCAARLTVTERAGVAATGSSLHTQAGLLAALADAGVTVEWPDPAAEPGAAGDAMRSMRAAGLRVACADVQLALTCGASSVEAVLALDAAARSTLLAPAERDRLASRVARDAKVLLSAASTSLAAPRDTARRASSDGGGGRPAASPVPSTAHFLDRRSPSPSPPIGLPPRPRSRASSPSVDAASLHGYGAGGGEAVLCSITPSGPGGYPLHWALCRHTPAPMVKLLLTSRPGDAATRDAAGRAPLHFAVAAGASPEVLAALVASCPAAADWADVNGDTPGRLARAMGADQSVMDALLPKARQQLEPRIAALSLHESPAGTPSRDAWRLGSRGPGHESASRVPSSQSRGGGGGDGVHAVEPFGSPAYDTPARNAGHSTSEAGTPRSGSLGHAASGDDDERCVHDIGAWLDAAAPPSHTIPPAAVPLVARLRQEWGVIDRDSGLGGGKLHRRIQLLRGLSHEAARHACLAPVLGTATRLDPMLPWVSPFGELPAVPPAHTASGSPAQQSWWGRLTAGAGSPTPAPDASAPPSPPCAVDVACPECRSAMLRETYLCGRYLVQRRDTHPLPALCGVNGCAAIMQARDTLAYRTVGGAPEQVVLAFMRDKQAWLLERSARAALARAVGPVAAQACLTRLLRAHDASGGGVALGDGFDAPSSDTFTDELDARGLGLAPFVLVFELTGPSLDAALTAQREHLQAFRLVTAPQVPTLATPVFRSVVVRTDWTAVRVMAWHAATSLAVCHDAGLLHGAVCPSHLVASLDGNRWSLTSASAAVALASGGQLMCTPSGVGALRGCVPPEGVMRCEDGSPALRLVERGTAHAWAPATLAAAVSWDVWAFGALVFEASAGVTVLEAVSMAEGDGNPGEAAALTTHDALHVLASWDGAALEGAMRVWHQLVGEDVEGSRSAASLVARCLAPEPSGRPADARELLMSRFLNPLGGRVPTRAADLVSRGGPASAAASPEAGGAAVLIGVAASRSVSPGSVREWEAPLSERSASWTAGSRDL